MVTYRTAGAWGSGQGSDLAPAQVDENFFELASGLAALQDHADNFAGIDYFVISGSSLYVHLTNHSVIGPYTLPTATWNYEGGWLPITNYNQFDVVTEGGALYLVLFTHISLSEFDPDSSDGHGNSYYGLILAAPPSEIPSGTDGQVLVMGAHGAQFENLTRNIALFVEGSPEASELLLQYLVPEQMTFFAGLPGSLAYATTAPIEATSFSIYRNATLIGTVDFAPSPTTDGTFSFAADVTFEPGDILYLIAPTSPIPDAHLTNLSFTFIATLP